jgi:hypothetical protein
MIARGLLAIIWACLRTFIIRQMGIEILFSFLKEQKSIRRLANQKLSEKIEDTFVIDILECSFLSLGFILIQEFK